MISQVIVTETASKETGLAVGTPVIVGTDDSGAEAISTGVVALVNDDSIRFFHLYDSRDKRIG